ncbi:hypothetical protein FSP39_020072 [Pinctada imbricata]|uniref:OTU domain-containing protein n=1 Tax=Pinctada imbricata TaxID=66713 RepID=A0AA89BPP4_PINIB|nr:hypothetical protein FSP39_020072 [Pinctada imbricata]
MGDYLRASNMRETSVWASEVEIFASAHFLRTDIYVYSHVGSNDVWLKHSGQFVEPNLAVSEHAINLQHTHGNHYDIILNVISKKQIDAKEKDKIRKREKRTDENFRRKEREDKFRKRHCNGYREQEKERKSKTMDRESEKLAKQLKRKSAEYKAKEKENKLSTMDRESEKLSKQLKRKSELNKSKRKK